MTRLIVGAFAGLIATLPMSLVIAFGRWMRLLWTPPPKQITDSAAKRAGVNPDPSPEAFTVSWIAAHFGYGAACGAAYVLAKPILPSSRPIAGLLFGAAVWSVSYLGIMPALGLYPWPKDDSKSRIAVMIAAHAVFGVVTAKNEVAFARAFVTAFDRRELQSSQTLAKM
jgi:Protein of unknown function (DUF1440)/Family of unknown function (DUF6789)